MADFSSCPTPTELDARDPYDLRGNSNHHHHQPTATATTTTTAKSHRPGSSLGNNGPVIVDEIEGMIRVFKDGCVEQLPVMKEVPASWSSVQGVASTNIAINSAPTSARVHIPTSASL